MANKITAWSYSRYQTYTQCPRKAKYKFVDKLPEEQGDAAARGELIHKEGEVYLKGAKEPPESFGMYRASLAVLRKKKAVAEQEWAFTREWKPTSWFAKDAWVRVKADAVQVGTKKARVIDFKTGKRREEHLTQLSLYALATFILFLVNKVTVELWYLDDDLGPLVAEYTRDAMPHLMVEWENKSKPLLTDTMFAPNPSYLCRWCAFSKAKGGPCEY